MTSGWIFSFLPGYKEEWTGQLEAAIHRAKKAAKSHDEYGAVVAVKDVQSLGMIDRLNIALLEGRQHPDSILSPLDDKKKIDRNLLVKKEGRWLCFYRLYPTERPPRGVIMFTAREDTDPEKLRQRLLGSV